MKQPPVLFTPTLTEVQFRFATWRKDKKHRSRIPEELWAAAVMLSIESSVKKISKALGLGYMDLKKRVDLHQNRHAGRAKPSPDFIPIDLSSTTQFHPAECIVEMEHRNGNKMRMHFKGNADLDLQSFADSFWGTRL